MSEFQKAIDAEASVECCVCFEEIGAKNNCVTPCGHAFCFTCMSQCLARSNTCPCCRAVLMEIKEDEDDSDDEDYADNESDEDDDDDDEEDGHGDLITERLIKMEYTMTDIVILFTGRTRKNDEKYTEAYLNKLAKDFDTVCEDIDNEQREKLQMSLEDTRDPDVSV
jgi:hypothetical protein